LLHVPPPPAAPPEALFTLKLDDASTRPPGDRLLHDLHARLQREGGAFARLETSGCPDLSAGHSTGASCARPAREDEQRGRKALNRLSILGIRCGFLVHSPGSSR